MEDLLAFVDEEERGGIGARAPGGDRGRRSALEYG